MQRFVCSIAAAVVLTVVFGETAVAQRPGGSSGSGFERMFGFMDRNRNGTLDPEELARVPGPMREFLSNRGVDTSRPINRDTFMRMLPDMMESMRRRRDAERSSGDGRDSRFGDSRRDGGGFSGGIFRGGGSRGGGDRGGSSNSRSNSKPKQRPRVTVQLPAAFAEGDHDADGQIGLYEWKVWKSRAALTDFYRFDRNRDGFLTPYELVMAEKAPPVTDATASAAAVSGKPAQNAASAKSATATSSTPAATTTARQPAAAESPETRMANTYFRYMDRDGDAAISPEEWERSRRIRPMFEKAGIDLSKSMSKEAFVQNYVRAAATAKK